MESALRTISAYKPRSACRRYATVVLWLIMIPLIFVLTACQPTSTAAVATPSPGIQVFFPQLAPIDEPRASMAALLIGELRLESGCLRVHSKFSRDDTASALVVWPEDAQLQIQGTEVAVLDETGQVVARVGDTIELGGGEIKDYDAIVNVLAAHAVRETVPKPSICPGPYWLVSEGGLAIETAPQSTP